MSRLPFVIKSDGIIKNLDLLFDKCIYKIYLDGDMNMRADTHVHTCFSGVSNYKMLRFPESVTRPEKQVECARRNGMNIICITDHDSIKGAIIAKEYAKMYDDIDVIIGEEITSTDGEILAYWLNEYIPPGLPIEETIDLIHEQGGIAVAPHPYSFYVACLKDRILDLNLEGIEIINGGHIDDFTNKKAQLVFDKYPGKWSPFSGSDAHSIYTTGYNWTEFEGSGENCFYEAIKNKRTVACGVPAPAFRQLQWSIEVVLEGQKLLWKSLCGRLQPDSDNPLITKIITISNLKKIAGLISGFMYIIPPVPFIGEYLATTWLRKKSYKLLTDNDVKLNAAKEPIFKICVYVPIEYTDTIMDVIDKSVDPICPNYKRTFSVSEVTGAWKPFKDSKPFVGEQDEMEKVIENKIEFVVKKKDLNDVIIKIKETHPYEESMIDVYPVYNWKSII